MAESDLLYLKSQNIWFGISQADVDFVKMNQKPGWFPKSEATYSGFYLIEDRVYKIIHLNFLFGGHYKPFIPAHMVTLKNDFRDMVFACQELKTDINLPVATNKDYSEWVKNDYKSLLVHWFPVEKDMLLQLVK